MAHRHPSDPLLTPLLAVPAAQEANKPDHREDSIDFFNKLQPLWVPSEMTVRALLECRPKSPLTTQKCRCPERGIAERSSSRPGRR